MRRATIVGAVIVAGLVLSGCAASGVPEFDREQTDTDVLDLPARYDDLALDRDSTRLLADDGDFQYYAARTAEATACVIVVPDHDVERSIAGCGGVRVGLHGSGFPAVRFYPDSPPSETPDGWDRLSPNLLMKN